MQERRNHQCFRVTTLTIVLVTILLGLAGLLWPFSWLFVTTSAHQHAGLNLFIGVYVLMVAVFILGLVSYNGVKMLQVTKQAYRFEYDRRKSRQLAMICTNITVLASFVMLCLCALIQKVCLYQDSKIETCPVL